MLRLTIPGLRKPPSRLFGLGPALLLLVLWMEPVLAQSDPSLPSTHAASPALQARLAEFERRIAELAHAKVDDPKLRRLSPEQRQLRVEFVIGNIFFVALHELGHAVFSELKVPVLGREEDTADVFAILSAMRIIGDEFAHRILVGAAKGWFLTARRARRDGEEPRYYEQHGLDEQRAYHIICLMVGHDPVRFKELADQAGLPEDRRRSCGRDYDLAASSWEKVMTPVLRAEGQPKTPIEVVYGNADGPLSLLARSFQQVGFLELVAEYAATRYLWPAPMIMEMGSCGKSNARWTTSDRKMHICYELAQEFAELFGEHQRKSAGNRKGGTSTGSFRRAK